MNTNFRLRNLWLGLLATLLVLYALSYFTRGSQTVSISTSVLNDMLSREEEIAYVQISTEGGSSVASVTLENTSGNRYIATVADAGNLEMLLKDAEISYNVTERENYNLLISIGVPVVVTVLAMFLLMRMMGGMNGQAGRMVDFSKSRARLSSHTEVTMKDVAGMEEEKDELREVIEFLKNPKIFNDVGARIPKGIILVGAPGTGKTLLAKAVAGEANVPFYSISGSDFVEMFVGVGAARVRDMFQEAKKNAPCIIFIDEIDAVARRRGTGLGGSHDEREQTLNQMLVEMDGFEKNQGIIVMAATNRVDILDPAIMRPGRFDRKIVVGHPDVKAREAILNVHATNKHLSSDVNLEAIARTTAGFTGADLENLLNEAAIEAAINGRTTINQADIEDAFIKTGIGKEKRSKIISEGDKRITAYHESGHAMLFYLLEDLGPVHIISIIPTGEGAAGYTMPLPDRDYGHITKKHLKHMIMASMGGRIAEELVCDDITAGASQDIKQVTRLARAMVMQYGMSDKIGMINCDENSGDDVFLGYDIAHNRTYGEKMLSLIDSEIKNIIDECYQAARELITQHTDVLNKSCRLLMEKEKISGEEFSALFA